MVGNERVAETSPRGRISSNGSVRKASSERKPSQGARVSQVARASNSVRSILSRGKDERVVMYADGKKKVKQPLNITKSHQPNKMVTSRFTALTWLPLSLLGQFKRVANWYFLFISVIVCFSWSPKRWESKIGPFSVVLFWTALKDLFEDWRRRRDDRAVNSLKCQRVKFGAGARGTPSAASSKALTPGTAGEFSFEEVTWAEVQVGDVLFIPEGDAFAADMLLIHASGGSDAFISTVMLDGETSLKERSAPGFAERISLQCLNEHGGEWEAAQIMETRALSQNDWKTLEVQLLNFVSALGEPGIEIRFANPSTALNDVRGLVQFLSEDGTRSSFRAEESCPFTESHFLPRGCVLQNTRWVLGSVLYVGDETKTRLNSLRTQSMKFSNMQTYLNQSVWGLLGILLVVCLYATVVSYAFAGDGKLAEETDDHPIIKFFKFCIIYYHVVPLSLYVIYEMLKLLLGYRLNTDPRMYDKETEKFATARTADLMEEMGQVDFLFSDKTGTLTANEMVFARCHVNGEDLGCFLRSSAADAPPGVTRVRDILQKAEDAMFEPVLEFFTCLSLCHSVVVSSGSSAPFDVAIRGLYAGPSPDEVALVEAAHTVGIRFESRERQQAGTSSDLRIAGPGEQQRTFTLLYELPFSSDRKRMSVLVKREGTIWCMTKGADSVMEGLLTEPFSPACKDDILRFSRQGLRTLVVAMKRVPAAEFEQWNKRYVEARSVIDTTKDEEVAKVAAEMEQGLRFLGVTAVEDKLQEGVPEAIATMKDMGLRVWVLTGDKTETAVDIARSCLLFQASTTLSYVVGATSGQEAEARLAQAHQDLAGTADTGLVLDGQTLTFALVSNDCRRLIYQLGLVSRSCVCCRLSPKQKLELVELVREHDSRSITLSVGDGANDVPMIYGAHVGVAIRGKEGTQAVQASDVAISCFKFLVPLLQCHGRRAYRRIAIFLCYFFYKNLGLIMLDLVWMHQNRFTATPAMAEWLSINYNVFFTSLHVLFVLGFDTDVPDQVAEDSPELYKVGPQRALFNARVFSKWLALGLWHGAVAWCVPYFVFAERDGLSAGDYSKEEATIFWVSSVTSLTTMILIVCLKLVLVSENPLSKFTLLPTFAAWAIYLCILLGLSEVSLAHSLQPNLEGIAGDFFGNSGSYLSMGAATVIALTPDVIERALSWVCCPSALQLAKRQYPKASPLGVEGAAGSSVTELTQEAKQ